MVDTPQLQISAPPQALDSLSYDRSSKLALLFQERMNFWQEEVWITALNSQLQLIDLHLIFRGTADSCPIHPRDLFRILIQNNASFFVLAHNHPSGSLRPSREDLRVTEKIRKAGQLMEIPMIDHLIITVSGFYSFADAGRLKLRKA